MTRLHLAAGRTAGKSMRREYALTLPRGRAVAIPAAIFEGVAPVPIGGPGWSLADGHPS